MSYNGLDELFFWFSASMLAEAWIPLNGSLQNAISASFSADGVCSVRRVSLFLSVPFCLCIVLLRYICLSVYCSCFLA